MSVPEFVFPSPPYKYSPEVTKPGRINISLAKVIGKKAVHKSACIRRKIGNRIQTAISLIVTRGADIHIDKNGHSTLEFKEEDVGKKWVLSGRYLIASCCAFWIHLDSQGGLIWFFQPSRF